VLVQLRGYVDLARWLYFDFQPSDACRLATWRHDIFRRRVIRQKNGAGTFYTLHTSRSSGGILLTNEELPRVGRRVATSRSSREISTKNV